MTSTTIPWESAQPPAEETTAKMARGSTDASRLSFPLQLVVMVVCAAIAAYGAVWQAQLGQQQALYELRSEVRNINTLIQAQRDLAAKDSQMWEERFAAMKSKADADAELRRVLLQQYEKANNDFQRKMLSR